MSNRNIRYRRSKSQIDVREVVENRPPPPWGPVQFEATAYTTRFNNCIFRRLTGSCAMTQFATCAILDGQLKTGRYSQQRRGLPWRRVPEPVGVLPLWSGVFGIGNQFEWSVRRLATALPYRVFRGAYRREIFWRDANWLAPIQSAATHFAHDIAANETPPRATATSGLRSATNRPFRASLGEVQASRWIYGKISQ